MAEPDKEKGANNVCTPGSLKNEILIANGRSFMNREVHVRICESSGVNAILAIRLSSLV